MNLRQREAAAKANVIPGKSKCPSCGGPNDCEVADGMLKCWCMELDPVDANAIKDRHEACLCNGCLKPWELTK